MTKLSEVRLPGVFSVQHIEDHGEATIRLKRLGVCGMRRIEVLQTGDPMILRVAGSRIGVSRQLACHVTVIAAKDSTEEVPRTVPAIIESAVGTA